MRAVCHLAGMPICRARLAFFATWLHAVECSISEAKQISYNSYAFKWTGVVPTLLDRDGEPIATSYSYQSGVGGILTVDSYSQYNNVERAGQLNKDGAYDTFTFETWRFMVQQRTNDGSNRYAVEASTDPSSPYQLYMPRLSVTIPAGRQLGHPGFGSGDAASGDMGDASSGEDETPAMLHIQSARIAPFLTYASINGGVIVSADTPTTYSCTGHGASAPGASYVCGYSVSVPLPPYFDSTSKIQSCALISETQLACNESPNFPPSPPSPPSPPPSPPSPPPPPWPEVAALTRMDVAGWVVTGILIPFFLVLGLAVHYKQKKLKLAAGYPAVTAGSAANTRA